MAKTKITKTKKYKKFHEGYYLEVYILAKSGCSDIKIEQALGIGTNTLRRWCKAHPYLKEALDKGREAIKSKDDFKDWVVGRLPDHLKDLWDEIMEVEEGNSQARKDVLLADNPRAKQFLFIHALLKTNFNQFAARNLIGVSANELKVWQRDEDFVELLEVIHEAKKDFVEGALMDLVSERDRNAVIFANKSINADRGYGQKIQVEHKGNIEHNHNLIDLDQLKIPLKLRMELLHYIQLEQEKLEQLKLEDHTVIDAEFIEKESA